MKTIYYSFQILFFICLSIQSFSQNTNRENFYTIKKYNLETGEIENLFEIYQSVYAVQWIGKDRIAVVTKIREQENNSRGAEGASGPSFTNKYQLKFYDRSSGIFETLESPDTLIFENQPGYHPELVYEPENNKLFYFQAQRAYGIDLNTLKISNEFELSFSVFYSKNSSEEDWKELELPEDIPQNNEELKSTDIVNVSESEISILRSYDTYTTLYKINLTPENFGQVIESKIMISWDKQLLLFTKNNSKIIVGNENGLYLLQEPNYNIETLSTNTGAFNSTARALTYLQNSDQFIYGHEQEIELLSAKENVTIQLKSLNSKLPFNITDFSIWEDELIFSREFADRGDLNIFGIGASIARYENEEEFVPSAEKDILEITEILKAGAKGLYENINIYQLNGEDVSSYSVDSILTVMSNSFTSKDNLYVHVSGYSINAKVDSVWKYLILSADPKQSIDAAEFLTKVLDTNSQSSTIVLDVNESKSIFNQITEPAENTNEMSTTRGVGVSVSSVPNNRFFLIGNDGLSYATEDGYGELSSVILDGLSGNADFACPGDGVIEGSELEGYIRYASNKVNSNFYTFSSRSDQDTKIAFVRANKFGNSDFFPPEIKLITELPQDSITQEKDITLDITAKDNVGIYSVQINDREMSFKGNNRYSYTYSLRRGDNRIEIVALDQKKNKKTLSFNIKREEIEQSPSNLAIFFASNEYIDSEHWKNLQNPIKDAEAIASELNQRFGFDTLIIRNPSERDIRMYLSKTSKKAYKPSDQVFIFFAGHGYFTEQTGYIVPSKSEDYEWQSDYLSFNDIRGKLEHHGSNHILLAVDVCYGASFFPDLVNESVRRSESRGASGQSMASSDVAKSYMIDKSKYRTRIAVSSGGLEEVYDGDINSPFTKKILTLLRNTSSGEILTIADFRKAVEDIKEYNDRRPVIGEFQGNMPGSDFVFIAK